MYKRFQIWWYLKLLQLRFRKNGKWEISNEFILAVVDGFKDIWLEDVKMLNYMEVEIRVFYKTLNNLNETVSDLIRFITEQSTITVDGFRYTSFPETKILNDYLIDGDKKPVNVYDYQKHLKVQINRLVKVLEDSKVESDLQYGYYHRNCEKVFSDTLELYWSFLEVAR